VDWLVLVSSLKERTDSHMPLKLSTLVGAILFSTSMLFGSALMTKPYLAGCFLVGILVNVSDAQIKGIEEIETAKERLSEYLSRADENSDLIGIAWRRSDTESYKPDDRLFLLERSGVSIKSEKRKLRYSMSQRIQADDTLTQRSEAVVFEGKMFGKYYPLNSKDSNGEIIRIEYDPTKIDWNNPSSRVKASMFGKLSDHFELDPFGMPLCKPSEIIGANSSMHNLVRFWIGHVDFVSEERKGSVLTSKWQSKLSDLYLEFDDNQGGLPALLRSYGKGNSKTTETKITWAKYRDEDRWVPKQASFASNDGIRSLSYKIDLEILPKEVTEKVANLDWAKLIQDKKASWINLVLQTNDENNSR
jgi:hypothetical protein